MKKRTHIWLAAAAAVIAVLAGTMIMKNNGGEKKEDKKSIRVGVALYRGDDPFINNIRSKLEEKAKSYEKGTGVKVVMDVADAKGNQNTQNSQVDRFLSLGYDAICVNMVDRSAASYVINKAMDADIPVIFFNREPVEEDMKRWVYGDNVFEKDGIRRDRTGDGEKTRCLCGKRGIFNRDGPAMGPQIIRQLERGASRRSASFFHALASPGRPRNGGGASGAYQPAEGRKALIQGRFRAQEGPLGPSRKSQQQTKRTGFAALEDSIADEAPEGKRAKRANRALNRAGINSRGQKQGFGGADRRAGRVTSR